MRGGKLTRDMKIGQIVNRDDLKGDTPSVLKIIPMTPFFVRLCCFILSQ